MIFIIVFLGIVFLISLLIFTICLSNLEIEIENFKYNSDNLNKEKKKDYLIYIRLKLLKRLTWFKVTIDDDRISKIRNSNIVKIKILKRILLRNEREIFTIENIKHIEHFEIKKLNLKMKIDLIDTIITSFSVAIISTIISIILANNIRHNDNKKYNYIITPIYKENMQIIINLNCIINVKMVHIINILYMLFKKRSVNYDERTSNRRAYVCSDE